jgi:phage regulator Rha-like protein
MRTSQENKNEFVSSRQIAETTEKRHADVMRDIKVLIDKRAIDLIVKLNASLRSINSEYTPNLGATNDEPICIEHQYVASNGKSNPQYLLNEYAANVLAASYDPVIARKLLKLIKQLHDRLNKPLSPAEAFMQQAQLMLAHEREIAELKQRTEAVEGKVNGLLEIQANNQAELKALPVSSEVLPEMNLRDKIRLLVNQYCQACSVAQHIVWENVYQTLYYIYHVPIKSYAKIHKNESWLDVADRKGHIDKIYIIVSNMLKSKGLSNT